MQRWQFQAFGTHWEIIVAAPKPLPSSLQTEILSQTQDFEAQFSRFRAKSQVNSWRTAQAGTYQVTPELAELLELHQELKLKTNGLFDPAVGGILEAAGYDATYTFRPQKMLPINIPTWSIKDMQLTISGPIVFDFGGIGKGYWIDTISSVLTSAGFTHHLVDGGRDIFATSKPDNAPWNIAIEWPGRPGIAIGTVQLKNQGFAASDTVTRAWGKWHHLIDIQHKKPREGLLGTAVVAPSALSADILTSAILLCPEAIYAQLANEYLAEYIVYGTNESLQASPGWTGEIF